MKQSILTVLGLAFSITNLSARIGETPAQLEARFGSPIKEALGANGYGLRVYHSEEFSEIRVLFIEGISEIEEYKCGESEIPAELIDSIREENPGQQVFDGNRSVKVRSERALATEGFSRELADRDQREHTYSGQVTIRNEGDWHRAILRDRDTVIEIPILSSNYPQDLVLSEGDSYSITVLDQDFEDLNISLAVISRREHTDWHDAVGDAGVGGIQQLVRIISGDKVVFDRSVCGLHGVKMELRNVRVNYGMYGPKNRAESYCVGHFPHFRDFALGGCLMGEAESTSIYICPKCIAECDDYMRQHPKDEEDKDN
jgi:hypothetical protein